MTRFEAVLAASIVFLMLTAALTYGFGWIALAGCSAVALVVIVLTADFERG